MGIRGSLQLGGLRLFVINHARVVLDEILTPVGVGSVLRGSSNDLLRLALQLAPLVLPCIRLHALEFRIVYFDFP